MVSKVLRHEHMIIRAEITDPPTEMDVGTSVVNDWLESLIQHIGMKLYAGPWSFYVKTPGNKGCTSVCIIETSHIAMHIWDECVPAIMQLDVYSCSELDPEEVLVWLRRFNPIKVEYKFLDREKDLQLLEKRNTHAYS